MKSDVGRSDMDREEGPPRPKSKLPLQRLRQSTIASNPLGRIGVCNHMTMSLTDLIQVIPPDNEDEEAEDIFAFAAGLIFTDDLRNFHGDDRSLLVYKSARFGDIELRAADPVQEDDRKLFAQYLWNAGIKMAEMISHESGERWCVKDKRVLELGAGG